MVNSIRRPHKYELYDQDWKCFVDYCMEKRISTSKQIEKLVQQCLKDEEDVVLKINENRKKAIEKRKKKI